MQKRSYQTRDFTEQWWPNKNVKCKYKNQKYGGFNYNKPVVLRNLVFTLFSQVRLKLVYKKQIHVEFI